MTRSDSYGLRRRYPYDITGVFVLRSAGCYVDDRTLNVAYNRHTWRFRLLGRNRRIPMGNGRMWAWIAVYVALLAWHVSDTLAQSNPVEFAWRSTLWSFVYAAAAIAVFWLPHALTQGFLGISVPLWEMLTARGRRAYENWYARRRSLRDQLIWAVLGAVGTGVALGFVQGAVEAEGGWLIIVPASYGVVVLTGFIVGGSAYWAAWGIWLCVLLSRRGRLRLYRFGPAYTPGVEELSRLMLNTASAGIFVVAALLTPLLIGTANLDDDRLTIVRGALIAICAVTLIGVAVVPQLTLSRAIRESRRANLRRLMRRYDTLEREARSAARGRLLFLRRLIGPDPEAARREIADEIERLAESPTSTIGSGNTVQILASAAGIMAPTIIGILAQSRA